LLRLTNASRAGCALRGYPGVALSGSNGVPLRFTYRRGGGQMLTSSPPTRVWLRPGATAYLGINKQTCIARQTVLARHVQAIPARSSTSAQSSRRCGLCTRTGHSASSPREVRTLRRNIPARRRLTGRRTTGLFPSSGNVPSKLTRAGVRGWCGGPSRACRRARGAGPGEAAGRRARRGPGGGGRDSR
jgi:hypothetical protein